MPLRVDYNILNQKGTPAFYSDTFANRPAAGFAGRVFISTDTGAIYEDTGSTWTLIADAGAGTTGTLEQVTTNGKTTTKGISITGSTLNFDSSSVSANPITMIYDTSVNRLLTPVVRLYGTGNIATNYVELFGTAATQNRTVNFPDASGTVGISAAALTSGSVLFSGTGGILSESNATFFWDNTNKRLGIGNAAPGTKLDIHGTGTIATFNGTTTNDGFIGFQNAGTTKWTIGNQYAGGVNNFQIKNSAGTAIYSITGSTQSNFATNTVVSGVFTANNVGDQIRVSGGALDASIHTNSGDNFMYIGATSSSTKGLNIDLNIGSIGINTTPSVYSNYVYFDVKGNSTNQGGLFQSRNSDDSIIGSFFTNLNGLNIRTETASPILIGTAATTAVKIPNTNNVLINSIIDNGNKFQVSGTASFSTNVYFGTTAGSGNLEKYYFVGDTNQTVRFNNTNNVNGNVGIVNILGSNCNNTSSLHFVTSAGGLQFNVYGNGTFATSSDIRLKKNIETARNGYLEDINKIRIVKYNWNNQEDNEAKELGVIAQELEKIFPSLVQEGAKIDELEPYKVVKYSVFIPMLIKAIQELNDKLLRNNIN